MRSILRIGFALSCIMAVEAGSTDQLHAQSATPEEAAISALRHDLGASVSLDPRYALVAGASIEFSSQLRGTGTTRRLAALMRAGIKRYEDSVKCERLEGREDPPWWICELTNVARFVGVSKPEIEGDEATVFVTIWSRQAGAVEKISTAHWKTRVKRGDSGWTLIGMEIVAVS